MVIPIVVGAFVLRTVAVLVLRRRHAGAAAWVDRWWTWLPLAVAAALLLVLTPWWLAVPVVLAVGIGIALHDPRPAARGRA